MAIVRVGEALRRGSALFGDHPVLRWLVVSIPAMACFVVVVKFLFVRPTPREVHQVVGTYPVLSFAVVGVGLVLERVALTVRRKVVRSPASVDAGPARPPPVARPAGPLFTLRDAGPV